MGRDDAVVPRPRNCCPAALKDAVIVSLAFAVCVFAVDYFVCPILPDVRQFVTVPLPPAAASASQKLQSGGGLELQSGEDLRKGHGETTTYRNAPWKPGIGRWLSECTDAPLTSVIERFSSNSCKNDCGGRGVCNGELGQCRCFHGYRGKGCEEEEEFPCTVDEPSWRVSSCGANCDKTRSFCFCGEGTKYPARPVAESCGFTVKDGLVDWKAPDPEISESGGWCNVDPESYANWTIRETRCHCTYDGTSGTFCELPVQTVCINQCSGNGGCRGGFCACQPGWYGIDCSVPSSIQSLQAKLPAWILSSINGGVSEFREPDGIQLKVHKRRPLIYVYDLPPKFNSHLWEGRHYRLWCTNRQYDSENMTKWMGNLYASEHALLETLLASSHRTTNAEEADYFYVPSLEACARSQADSAPHTDMQLLYRGLRGYYTGALHKQAYEHIRDSYPYWNRSDGRDHIWLFPWDEGACSAPKEIWSSIMLVHWGNTNSKYNYSTTAYPADNWGDIPRSWTGSHPCFDAAKDIVMPAWKAPDPFLVTRKLWARTREERPILFYFNGNLGDMYERGRPEPQYSMGLRQKLAIEFGSRPNKNGDMGRQAAPDVIVMHRPSGKYGLELSRSRFCGVFPGDGWSGRMEDSILHGCIPVIVQDGIQLPFENVLDYDAFAVRIAEKDLPRLVETLRAINESRVDSMLSTVQSLWQRFSYLGTLRLELQRQKLLGRKIPDWAAAYDAFVGDDAFDTLIQVLHFKLGNRLSLNGTGEVRDSASAAQSCGDRSRPG